MQQRVSSNADGVEPDRTNCGVVAWTAACRHLERDTKGLRPYQPADRTALAFTVVAVTMGPMAAWPARLLPHVNCRDAPPRQPAPTHTPMAPLTAEQLYAVTAALLADGGESLVHRHGPAQIEGSIQGLQGDAPHPWRATLCGCTRVRDTGGGAPPPGPQQGEALVIQTAGYQAILRSRAAGYRSHILAEGKWTVWHGTARQRAFPPWSIGGRRPLRPTIWRQTPGRWQSCCTPSVPQASGPSTLVWSLDQEEHLRAARQEDAIRTADVPDLHAGPITHAGPAATLQVAQRGQQSPKWLVCMFSPADAHIAVCDPGRLPGPEAVISA